ncbi:MAG TPA: sulfite exporter TauE/SafE family protein [Candidatus Paceibacterota bacterium]|nr:sulfite exporter TauE/SafE family protein [Candidatus Paceibacterota bacterium]HMP18926.1 sulfite exporter TauE/SafE family protein [Candidatus Paceibacterota bacterium]HMP85089.1 sulfite exporter TauE/SafE family protein [Candidatus Paceibacterota bacterium]
MFDFNFLNLINGENINYLTAFFIGAVASISSCMIVTGGLILSLSTNLTDTTQKNLKPIALFHVGRLISFFLLGGLIGFLGSFFTINFWTAFAINFLIGIVMLILGINMLGFFGWIKIFQFFIPQNLSDRIKNFSTNKHPSIPFVIGFMTFFLPCGFTQSIQFYVLGTGSFWSGALTMLFFAIGTFPALFAISFGVSIFNNSKHKKNILRIAGLVIIIFSLIILSNSLNLLGFNVKNIFNKENNNKDFAIENISNMDLESLKNLEITENVSFVDDLQYITISANNGYKPRKSVANANTETIIRFDTEMSFDCSTIVNLPSLKINKRLPPTGSTEINIGIQKQGIFRGSCGMGMFPFEIYFK